MHWDSVDVPITFFFCLMLLQRIVLFFSRVFRESYVVEERMYTDTDRRVRDMDMFLMMVCVTVVHSDVEPMRGTA
jgi:hypothetical protein